MLKKNEFVKNKNISTNRKQFWDYGNFCISHVIKKRRLSISEDGFNWKSLTYKGKDFQDIHRITGTKKSPTSLTNDEITVLNLFLELHGEKNDNM